MAREMKRWIIAQSLASRVGHVGSALSIADILAALWEGVMRRPGTTDPERDRFLLGKGHGALALYAAMRWKGLMDASTFATYCADGSAVAGHPDHGLPGVDFSTGSLGQALSVACGLAYAWRQRGRGARAFVLLSDAECNEGQVWEAAMFARHHALGSVRVVVDVNGLQALGRTRDILDVDLAAAWRGFGWEVVWADGHDAGQLIDALGAPSSAPRAVLARTTLGRGVAFMEDRLEWHYRNLTPELAREALDQLGET